MSEDAEKTICYRRVIDLSHPVTPGMPRWPGDPPVAFDIVAQRNRDGYFLRRFSMGEHSGTHLASPSAYHEGGLDSSDVPVESLIAPAVVIDISGPAGEDPDYALSATNVAEWEREHGPIPAGSLVLLNTGWSRYWKDPQRFINADATGIMHTPGFSLEAVRFLLEWRDAGGFGIDTHGIDAGMDGDLSVSRFALGQSALALECLNALDRLPATGATIIVGRLRLVGGSGSPASVIALTP